MMAEVNSINSEKSDIEMNDKVHEDKDEEMEEGEASDDDIEVNVTIGVEDVPKSNKGNVSFGPSAPVNHSESMDSRRNHLPYYMPNMDTLLASAPAIPIGGYMANIPEIHNRTLVDPAKRFGIEPAASSKYVPSPQSVKYLYKSLGVGHSDFIGGWWRSDILHVWTSDFLEAGIIKHYFRNHAPAGVVWLSQQECNVYWSDINGPICALLGLSCPILYPGNEIYDSAPHPRPPTRRHNTSPLSVLPTQADTIDSTGGNDTNFIKKKSKKKSKKSDGSSSSTDYSSSDSDSDSSSSSSTSDSDSSDSDSDSSSTDSDSSSSSSDSDSSDSENAKEKKRKKKKKKAKAALKAAKKSAISQKMEVVAEQKLVIKSESVSTTVKQDMARMEGDDSTAAVRLTDLPVCETALPRGRWRLGVPCRGTRTILLRFAHADDLHRAAQLQRRQQETAIVLPDSRSHRRSRHTDEEGRKKKKRRDEDMMDEDDVRRQEKRRMKREARGVKARPSAGPTVLRMGPGAAAAAIGDALSQFLPTLQPHLPPHLPIAIIPPVIDRGTYRDLDNPQSDSPPGKNPWGGLAETWGKRETRPFIDYQEMLHKHMSGQKRKRSSSDDDEEDEAPARRSNSGHHHNSSHTRRTKVCRDEHYTTRRPVRRPMQDSDGDERRLPDYCEEDEEGSSLSDAGDDVVAWNKKITLPRMKMYADDEEKRRKVSKAKRPSHQQQQPRWDRSHQHGNPPRDGERKRTSIFRRLGGGVEQRWGSRRPPYSGGGNIFRGQSFDRRGGHRFNEVRERGGRGVFSLDRIGGLRRAGVEGEEDHGSGFRSEAMMAQRRPKTRVWSGRRN